MNPFQAVGSCLRQFVGFSGRASRSEFWWWTVFAGLVYVVGSLLFVNGDFEQDADTGPGSVAWAELSTLLFLPTLAVTVRRLHDANWSGWWALANALLGAGAVYAAAFGAYALGVAFGNDLVLYGFLASAAVWLIVFVRMFVHGTDGANRFGPDPFARSDERGDP